MVVVGGGGAGMCAAIEAHDAGARVALLDADNGLGGSTAGREAAAEVATSAR